VGMLAHSLEKSIGDRSARQYLLSGDLALVTPYSPNAGFTVGAALSRNKLIYALADQALVIASDVGTGGTWAGATQALKAGWSPVYVLMGPDVPQGNKKLADLGAIPFPVTLLDSQLSLREWLEENRPQAKQDLVQGNLFA
jgi:predicted Rossmann fold nucleotide-binding protein DprA/Smf involved in DNA uptake